MVCFADDCFPGFVWLQIAKAEPVEPLWALVIKFMGFSVWQWESLANLTNWPCFAKLQLAKFQLIAK